MAKEPTMAEVHAERVEAEAARFAKIAGARRPGFSLRRGLHAGECDQIIQRLTEGKTWEEALLGYAGFVEPASLEGWRQDLMRRAGRE